MLQAKFATLRQILLDLGFEMKADSKRILFDHPEPKTRFLYPPYREDQQVDPGDLVAARHILDMKGFLPRERFEELLREKQLAG
jgi:hypothetical protein